VVRVGVITRERLCRVAAHLGRDVEGDGRLGELLPEQLRLLLRLLGTLLELLAQRILEGVITS
jgi:hypothetical protein